MIAIVLVAVALFFLIPIGVIVFGVLVIIGSIWAIKSKLDEYDKEEPPLKENATSSLSEDSKMLNILLQGRECHCGRYKGNVAYFQRIMDKTQIGG